MYLKKKKKKIECSGFNLEALLSAEPGSQLRKPPLEPRSMLDWDPPFLRISEVHGGVSPLGCVLFCGRGGVVDLKRDTFLHPLRANFLFF